MPIGSFIQQPFADSISATYRPVVIRVLATNTDGTPTPPVVYCDIYFNDVFYKTLSKTQYTKLNVSATEWEFDIQDAGQEYLQKFLGMNGEKKIIEAVPLVAKVKCKFRSSGLDINGFILWEGTAPVQGTSSTPPIPGTGTESNEFYIVNATLQHTDAQDLASHLFYFKNRTWTAAAFPLTHRPDNYRGSVNQSDIFPLLYSGIGSFKKIRLNYKYCGQNTFNTAEVDVSEGGTIPSCTALISTPNISPNSGGYELHWVLISGSPVKYIVSCQGWNGGTAVETGDTSVLIASLPPGDYVFTVRPVCLIGGETYIGQPKSTTLHIEDTGGGPVCEPAGWSGSVSLPDGVVGTPYSFSFDLTGTPPFTITIGTKPSWLTIAVAGNTVNGTGTPNIAGESIDIFFTINNCFDGEPDQSNFSDQITVLEALTPIEGRFALVEGAICSVPGQTFYINAPVFGPGVRAYYNPDHTGPVGTGFIADSSGAIYDILDSIVGAPTGNIC